MTREEAIKIIDCYDIGFYDLSGAKIPADKLADAFDMAIEALQQEPKWIPVTKALPRKGVKVLVQTSYPNLTYVAEIGSFLSQPEGWRTADGYERIEQTVAWMPLPEPYEGSDE